MAIWSVAVNAQPEEEPDPSTMSPEERLDEALRLSELGRLHFEGREFEEAADAFSRAWSLHPDPVLGYNAGRSYENAGDYQLALAFYQATLDLEPADADIRDRCSDGVVRITNILSRLEEDLSQRPARVEVRSDPEGAVVRIDGDERGSTPMEIELLPGTYEFAVALDTYEPYEETVSLEPAQALVMRITLVPIPQAAGGDGDLSAGEGPDEEGGPNWVAVGITGGLGAGSIVLGALAAAVAQDKYDDAQAAEVQRNDDVFDTTVDEGRGAQAASTLFYSLGIGAVITAVILYFVTDDSPEDDVAGEAAEPETAGVRWGAGPTGVTLEVVW
jgi:tetratricopeptide (TPR) repeat protein